MKVWRSIKRNLRLLGRQWSDRRSGLDRKFARGKADAALLDSCRWLQLEQVIMPGATFQNKHHNIALASKAISGLELAPGQVFSFWDRVGAPLASRGFLPSRNIVAGKLSQEVGGGLCQVSGIIYQLALRAGLQILERHAHSVDIYTEEERYAPLGADATVVYGYKDLRLQNTFAFSLVFRFELKAEALVFLIGAPVPLSTREVTFRQLSSAGGVWVETVDPSKDTVLDRSFYKRP